jgi:hypothetical protein
LGAKVRNWKFPNFGIVQILAELAAVCTGSRVCGDFGREKETERACVLSGALTPTGMATGMMSEIWPLSSDVIAHVTTEKMVM